MDATIISSTRVRFDAMVKAGELLEWAEVFGYRYGTPRGPVEKALRAGRDVLFDIDWQGTQQLREKARDDLVSVFVLPPSVHGAGAAAQAPRAGQPSTSSRSRMAKAAGEMSHWPEYDYVIVNRDKDEAFAEVRAILAAERLQARAADRPFRFRARAAGEIVTEARGGPRCGPFCLRVRRRRAACRYQFAAPQW